MNDPWRTWGQNASRDLLEKFESKHRQLAVAIEQYPGSSMAIVDNGHRRTLIIRLPVPEGALTVEESCPPSH